MSWIGRQSCEIIMEERKTLSHKVVWFQTLDFEKYQAHMMNKIQALKNVIKNKMFSVKVLSVGSEKSSNSPLLLGYYVEWNSFSKQFFAFNSCSVNLFSKYILQYLPIYDPISLRTIAILLTYCQRNNKEFIFANRWQCRHLM